MAVIDLKVIISALDRTAGAFTAIESRLSGVADRIGKVGQTMSLAVTAPLAIAGGMALRTANDFDTTMRAVRGIAEAGGATGDEIGRLNEIALEFGRKGMFGPKQVATAMEDMVRDGITPARIEGGHLAAVYDLATAGAIQLADAQIILSDTMAVFGGTVEETNKYASALLAVTLATPATMLELQETMRFVGTAAVTAGMDVHEASGAIGVLANMGYRGSIAGTALARAIDSVTAPTAGAREVIEELGLQMFEADGTMRHFEDIINDVRTATAGMTEEQKIATLDTLFDIRARRAVTLLMEAQEGSIRKMEQATKDSNLTQEVAAKMAKGMSYEMAVMKANMEVVQIEMVTALAPALKVVTDFISGLAKWVSGLSEEWKRNIGYILIFLAVLGPLLIIVSMLSKAFLAIKGAIRDVKAGVVFLKGAFTALKGVLIFIKGIFVLATIKIWLIIAAVLALVAGIIWLWHNWDEVWVKIKEIAAMVLDWFQKKWEEVWTKVKEVFAAVLNWLSEKWTAIWEGIRNLIASVVEWIMPPINTIVDGLNRIIDTARRAIEWLNKQREMVAGAATRAVTAVTTPVVQAVGNLLGRRQLGGIIPETGRYLMHRGEYVTPAHRTTPSAVNVNITGGVFLSEDSAERIGNLIVQRLKQNIRI